MPDLQQEGRADWLPVPLRRDLLLHTPLHGLPPVHLRLQDGGQGADRQAEPRRDGREDQQDLMGGGSIM
jgi:hypothetical protein